MVRYSTSVNPNRFGVINMYAIHTTPGFIIDSRPYSEAGKILSIFTRDFGLVQATAQGIRLEKSKLRYHTQEYSFGEFSLVRGKEFWRITSAQELENVHEESDDVDQPESTQIASARKTLRECSPTPELIARLALLLRRLLHGEEPHLQLFDIVKTCADFLKKEDLTDEQLKSLESLTVVRIMNSLGYVGADEEVIRFLQNNEITEALLDIVTTKRTLLNGEINRALRESHL